MNTNELKQSILKQTFGGVMYDVSRGSPLLLLIQDNAEAAHDLANEIKSKSATNGVDKGILDFLTEHLGDR